MSDEAVERSVSPPHLLALLKEYKTQKARSQSINGALGERIKEAIENGNLNRKAFSIVAGLDKCDDEMKRNSDVRAIRLYLDIAEEQLWGDGHVGDLDDMARRSDTRMTIDFGDGQTVEMTTAQMAEAADSLKNAEGIGELPPEAHEENQKPRRRGRSKAATEKAQAELDAEQSAEEDGAAAFLARKGATVPDTIAGDKVLKEAWLRGWSAEQIKLSKQQDAETFDRVEAAQRGRAPLAGADAPGSYEMTH